MNINTEKLVSVFSQDELAAMMTAMGGYINTKSKQRRSTGIEVVAFNKIVDALLAANYLNAVEVEVKPNPNAPMGSAEYKAYEAMYESDVRAHS
jgi:sugar phosphate isomerase/epimerase